MLYSISHWWHCEGRPLSYRFCQRCHKFHSANEPDLSDTSHFDMSNTNNAAVILNTLVNSACRAYWFSFSSRVSSSLCISTCFYVWKTKKNRWRILLYVVWDVELTSDWLFVWCICTLQTPSCSVTSVLRSFSWMSQSALYHANISTILSVYPRGSS